MWSTRGLAQGINATEIRLRATIVARRGSRSAGIGADTNNRLAMRASQRPRRAERWTRALSVLRPVFALHLAIQLGDEDECQAGTQSLQEP